ncbi:MULTISPECIES: hypothetical protein [unclassified Bradyrhizobium]|uniref:hypothetical protein n=1 Tax=unclassified Bradyrhizobium TaxID=2631580 RepID=UPI00291618AE|nr:MULTISPECIES: hypothetical protein [unclassified Bradyrhizobium]
MVVSQSSMSQGTRAFLILVMILAPVAAPLFVKGVGLANAELKALPSIAAVFLISLALTLVPTSILERIMLSEPRTRIMRIAFSNLIFVVLDAGIFSVLVYGRHYAHQCRVGPECDLYPMFWLALTGMHICYVAIGCVLWLRTES